MARDRLRTENDLREAEELIARLRGVSLNKAAQALKDHARLVGTPVVDVARAVIVGTATVSPVGYPRPQQPPTHADRPAS